MMRDVTLPVLSLYTHFPWCVRKCPYCDFNSHALHGDVPEDDYLAALATDLAGQIDAVQGRAIETVFFGGGTPSLFSPGALARLLGTIRSAVTVARDAEITLEANPGTIERGDFAGYRAAGITRVSLGAQSFDPRQLERLGRIHAAADTERAVSELRIAGITNFNLDLMYGLPEQGPAGALADIERAITLEPTHLSHYQLTLEPGTVFGGRPPPGLPDPDCSADMQLACQERLAAAGYIQYETSAYARTGARCLHNLNYWRFGDYLGIGAGAHGKVTRFRDARLIVERTAQIREPRRYLAALARSEAGAPGAGLQRREIPAADLPFEFTMNALRLIDGFAPEEFEARTGLSITVLAEPIERARCRGLIESSAGRVRASARGAAFLNDLIAEFLPAGGYATAGPGA